MITYKIFFRFSNCQKKKCLIKFYFVLREHNLKESGTQIFFFKFKTYLFIFIYISLSCNIQKYIENIYI